MHNIRRGMRNIVRSPIRTGVVCLLVGLGLALAIMSLSMNQALDQQVNQLAGELGTELQIRPAGRFGGFGTGESTLTEDIMNEIAVLPNVVSVDKVLTVNMRLEQGTRSGMTSLTGIESVDRLNVFGGGTATLTTGRYFAPEDQGEMVAIISTATAEEQELGVGDIYLVQEHEFEIVGLFESEILFGRISTFVPLLTLQNIAEQEGVVSQATVIADRVENVQTLAASIRELVGEEIDVVVPQERQLAMFENTLGNLKGSNATNLVVALVVAGITIFFTLLLAVRERAREIGVLKALGASARDLITGFAWEGLTLAVLGCLIGIIIFGTAGQAAAGFFLDSALDSSAQDIGSQFPGMGQPRGEGFLRGRFEGLDSRLGDLLNPASLITENLQMSLSARTVVTVFAAAALLGTLGGLIPALFALRMKPAEVLRND